MTPDDLVAMALDHVPQLGNEFSRSCSASPALLSVAEAFLAECDSEMAAYRLRVLLIFLERVRWVNAAKLRQTSSIDREEQKAKAVALLRQAADALDVSFDIFKDVTTSLDTELPIPRRRQSARQLVKRILTFRQTSKVDLLRLLADEIMGTSVDDLMPVEDMNRFPNSAVELSNIGLAGRAAASGESASRGLIVKEIDSRLPIRLDTRYAIIEQLLAIRGITLSRQLVRGILLHGRT